MGVSRSSTLSPQALFYSCPCLYSKHVSTIYPHFVGRQKVFLKKSEESALVDNISIYDCVMTRRVVFSEVPFPACLDYTV